MVEVAKVAIAATALVSLFALIFVIYHYTGNKESQTFVKEGIKIERIKIPKNCGFIAGSGDRLLVQYKGWLDNGTVFDSSYKRKTPFEFQLDIGDVIRGWDVGLMGMCMQETRRLTVPANKGYGHKGVPPTIPSDATLHFEVELVGMY